MNRSQSCLKMKMQHQCLSMRRIRSLSLSERETWLLFIIGKLSKFLRTLRNQTRISTGWSQFQVFMRLSFPLSSATGGITFQSSTSVTTKWSHWLMHPLKLASHKKQQLWLRQILASSYTLPPSISTTLENIYSFGTAWPSDKISSTS